MRLNNNILYLSVVLTPQIHIYQDYLPQLFVIEIQANVEKPHKHAVFGNHSTIFIHSMTLTLKPFFLFFLFCFFTKIIGQNRNQP